MSEMAERAEAKPAGRGRGRVLRWTAVGLMGGLLAGGATVWAFGRDEGPGAMFGRRHFWHHRSGPLDAAQARERVEMGVKWAMKWVDGTPEQQQKVQAIAVDCLDDLLPLRERHQANRAAIHAALSGATVDRQALEQARKAELQLVEEASSRLAQAVADAAEVLTPAQRAELAQLHGRFHR